MTAEERMEEWEKRYPITCPYCKNEVYAKRSIGHMMGVWGAGSGVCVKCSRQMHLTYIPETDKMAAEPMEDWIKRIDKEIRESERETANGGEDINATELFKKLDNEFLNK